MYYVPEVSVLILEVKLPKNGLPTLRGFSVYHVSRCGDDIYWCLQSNTKLKVRPSNLINV